jgi:glucose dehydrogenase
LAKNESAFDLQLLAVDGKLHLLVKDQIDKIVVEKSLMPKVEASPSELRDLLAYLSRLGVDPNPKSTIASGAEVSGGISFTDVAHPKTGMWPTYHGNEGGNRFSPLDQINTTNIEHLAPKWLFQIGSPRGGGEPKRGVPSWIGLEVTPVVVDGVM